MLGDKVCGDMCPMHDVIREKDMSVCIIVERFQKNSKRFQIEADQNLEIGR